MAVVRIIPSRKTTTTQSTGARRRLHQELVSNLDVSGVFRVPCTCRVVKVAAEEALRIQYLYKSKGVRKENLVAEVIARRGTHPGLGHVPSVMKGCTTFKPWFDKRIKKKRIIRAVIKEIIVNTDERKRSIELKIHWSGGVHTHCSIRKNKSGHNNRATDKNVVKIVRVYAQAWSDRYIASLLNRMQLKTGGGNNWNETRVKNLRLYNKIPVFSKSTERTWLTMAEAAEELNVSVCVVKTMINRKLLSGTQAAKGAPWLIQHEQLSVPSVQNYVRPHLSGKKSPLEDQRQTIINYL